MRKYLTWVMSLTVLTYLIIAIAVASLLTGCSEFEAKLAEMNIINQNDGLQE